MNLCTSTSDIKTADGDESKDILVCDVEMLDGECEWIAGESDRSCFHIGDQCVMCYDDR